MQGMAGTKYTAPLVLWGVEGSVTGVTQSELSTNSKRVQEGVVFYARAFHPPASMVCVCVRERVSVYVFVCLFVCVCS